MTETEPAKTSPPQKRRNWRRIFFRAILIVLFLLCFGEIVSRSVLGLGDPLLYVPDPQIQFYAKPGTYHRFGNTISINAYSMRSPDFPPHKTDPNEVRVLVVGDSVIFGGSRVNQPDICTSLAQRTLHHDLHRPVVVGNISAGNWRLTNMDQYIKHFGTFDADAMILVLSNHDYANLPHPYPYTKYDADFPDHAPLFALQELISRYGIKYAKHYLHLDRAPAEAYTIPPSQADIDAGLAALRDILATAKQRHIQVAIVQHFTTADYGKSEKPGHAMIKATAESMDVPVIQLAPDFKAAMDAGQHPYNDDIHPTATGQAILGKAIVHEVESLLKAKPSATTTTATTAP